ncbi:MAG TPA: threonine--tRNA ligase, partial [Dehalococcoidia bacterium]|nr:threonine--tRNA ligase [Dehalococcoidia bacterium]
MSKTSVNRKVDLEALRHSASHVMAQAVFSLFPEARLGIGPAIEDGFYYDFGLPRPLTPEDLAGIETKMREAIEASLPFVRQEVDRETARRLFAHQPFKVELIGDIPAAAPITVYTQGDFT